MYVGPVKFSCFKFVSYFEVFKDQFVAIMLSWVAVPSKPAVVCFCAIT